MKCAALRVCASLLMAGASSLYAGTAPAAAPQEGSVISLHVENDMFVGDDDNYTSSVTHWLDVRHHRGKPNVFGHAGNGAGGYRSSDSWRRFMGMNGSSNLRQQWGLDLTQLMFTPERKLREPIYGEHPYVGNLTLGLISLVKNEDRANVLELQLGTTGSPSLAKGSQHLVHKMWGMEQWPGWNNQLPSEMTANLFFKRYYRLRGLENIMVPGWRRTLWPTGMRMPAP